MEELGEHVEDGVVWLALPEYDAISGEKLDEILQEIHRQQPAFSYDEYDTISDEELDRILEAINRP